MADSGNFVKGHWVKHFPKSLKEAIDGLSTTQELMVFRAFLYNGLYGKAIPFEQRERVFVRLETIPENIQFLLKTKILSEDDDKGLYLQFALEEFQVTNDQIRKRKEAGRKGGIKSSRNKISSVLPAKVNKDKDKDKDKDNKIISDTNVSSSFPAPENDGIEAELSELPDSENGNQEPAAISEKVELVEPELIEQLPDGQTSPRKALLKFQDTAIVEAVAARWQEMAKTCRIPGIRLPILPTRQKTLLSTMKKLDLSLDQVLQIIDILPESDFLSGRSSKWKADFSWFIKTENLNKVIDGKYHNEKSDGNNDGVATRLIDRYLKEKNKTDQE